MIINNPLFLSLPLQTALLLLIVVPCAVRAAVPESMEHAIPRVNRHGPFIGVVVPNAFEMDPLLRSSSFSPAKKGLPPYLDVAGMCAFTHNNSYIQICRLGTVVGWHFGTR
jgi:hypothetical protein